MKVLFLTQVLPYPLDAGPKIRAYHVLRHLAGRGHRLTLVSFVRDSDGESSLEHLRTFCEAVHPVKMRRSRVRDAWSLLASLAGDQPFLLKRDWVPEMVSEIRRVMTLSGPFDAIHADQLWMAPYALMGRRSADPERPPMTVLDQHNAVFQIPRRLGEAESNPLKKVVLGLEAKKMARFEARLCRQFDQVVWVTEEDRDALRSLRREVGATPDGTVIPICVGPDQQPMLRRNKPCRRVTFLGGLHWPPNAQGMLWFKRLVWPDVLRNVPGAKLTVIGKDPPSELTSDRGGGVKVVGYVKDPEPLLAETAVFVIPLLAGGGMRVKLLDAWCWGLPVVSTGLGAEGVAVRDGFNVLLADDPEAFAKATVRLLNEPAFGDRLAAQGRATVESLYDWRRRYQAWDEIYECAFSSSFPTLPA